MDEQRKSKMVEKVGNRGTAKHRSFFSQKRP